MDNIEKTLAKNIIKLRKQRGWSQDFLAHRAGLARGTIAQYECCERWPDPTMIRRVAKALGIDHRLLYREDAIIAEPTVADSWRVISQLFEELKLIPPAKGRPRKKRNTPPGG